MRRIIITAILTVICAVGACTSFAVNDLPNFGEWMKTNEPPQQTNGNAPQQQSEQGVPQATQN